MFALLIYLALGASPAPATETKLARAWSRCQAALVPAPEEFPVRFKNGEPGKVSALNVQNVRETWRAAVEIFPNYKIRLAKAFTAALIPREVLGLISRRAAAVHLANVEYWRLLDERGRVLGVTGLYAVNSSFTAWLGWYGLIPEARGVHSGRRLLEMMISLARDNGYTTLRLWTTDAPEYRVANEIFRRRGFVKQHVQLSDPDAPVYEIVLWSLSLGGEPPEPFSGDLREALLGATKAELARGIQAFARRPAQNTTPPQLDSPVLNQTGEPAPTIK